MYTFRDIKEEEKKTRFYLHFTIQYLKVQQQKKKKKKKIKEESKANIYFCDEEALDADAIAV